MSLNRINIILIYAFCVYPIIAYTSYNAINVAGHNFMGALVYLVGLMTLTLKKQKIYFPKYLLYYLIFVLITIVADFINGKTGQIIKYFYSNFYIKSFVLLMIIENTVFLKRHMKIIKSTLIIILSLSVIVIIIQVLFKSSFFVIPTYFDDSESFLTGYRPPSIFSWVGKNAFGFSIPAIISILVSENYLIKNKKYDYLVLSIGFFLSFLSKARWFMLSIFVIVFQVYNYERKNIFKYVFISIVLLFVTFQSITLLGIDYDKIINSRILEKDRGGLIEGSAGTRIFAFELFFEFFPENPIFGTGGIQEDDLIAARAGRTSQIHVGFLTLFYYYGIVGGAFYIMFLYLILKRTYYIAKKTEFWGSFYTLLAFVAANMTLVSLDFFKMGIIIALVFHKYYDLKHINSISKTNINPAIVA